MAAAAQSQGVGGDVFGDAAACGYVGAVADGDGCYEGRVGAYEDAVADGGEVLVDAVVVAGDGSGAYVDAGADDGIAEVVEVVGFGTLAHGDFFGFDEVAYVGVFADVAVGAKVGVWAEDGSVVDGGLVEDAAVADGDVVADGGVLDDGVGADAAVGADAGGAEDLDVRFDDGVGGDGDGGVDDAGFGAEDGDAVCHEAVGGGEAHGGVEVHHLGDGVGTEDLVDAVGFDGYDAFAVGYEHGGYVGEVELAVGVVGVECVEFGEELGGFEAVDAGVDLGRGELAGGEGFLLDDGCDLGAGGSGAEDSAVAGGVGGDGGEDGHGGTLGEVEVADGGDGFGADEGDVAGEDEKMPGKRIAGDGEVGLDHLEGVAGAALDFLEDEADAGLLDGGADAVGFVADDAVDVVGRNDGLGGGDDVEEEGAAADLVEDFGAFAFEPRALACGHDGDGESFGVHRDIVSCSAREVRVKKHYTGECRRR